MTEVERSTERFELIWALSSLVFSFHLAYRLVDSTMGMSESEFTKFLLGSVLGFTFGSSFALAGLPVLHGLITLKNKLVRREKA